MRAKVVKAILPNEVWINERWAIGDAVVAFPGYDVKVFPISGVLDETIFWIINANIMRSQ
jgi:hypothetical protein